MNITATVKRTKADKPAIEPAGVDTGANMLVGLVVTTSKMRFQARLVGRIQQTVMRAAISTIADGVTALL
jgi:hypothetical protein